MCSLGDRELSPMGSSTLSLKSLHIAKYMADNLSLLLNTEVEECKHLICRCLWCGHDPFVPDQSRVQVLWEWKCGQQWPLLDPVSNAVVQIHEFLGILLDNGDSSIF